MKANITNKQLRTFHAFKSRVGANVAYKALKDCTDCTPLKDPALNPFRMNCVITHLYNLFPDALQPSIRQGNEEYKLLSPAQQREIMKLLNINSISYNHFNRICKRVIMKDYPMTECEGKKMVQTLSAIGKSKKRFL